MRLVPVCTPAHSAMYGALGFVWVVVGVRLAPPLNSGGLHGRGLDSGGVPAFGALGSRLVGQAQVSPVRGALGRGALAHASGPRARGSRLVVLARSSHTGWALGPFDCMRKWPLDTPGVCERVCLCVRACVCACVCA